jgi:hypothetical protein
MSTSLVSDHRRSLLVWTLAVVALLTLFVGGQRLLNNASNIEKPGTIDLSEVSLQKTDGQLLLDASVQINLPATMQAGLDNGVPLTFIMELKLLEPRRFWLDSTFLQFQKRYTLTYYELTRHYRVHAVDSNVSQNYRSLSSALSGFGDFRAVEFALNQQQWQRIAHESDLTAFLQIRLDTAALPLPLQPLIRSGWSLASEEYRWQAI